MDEDAAQAVRADGAAMATADWTVLGVAALTWGASFLFIAVGLDAFPPMTVAFGRIALGALTLTVVPSAHRRVEAVDRGRFVLLGVVWMAVPLSCLPIAEQWISSSLAGLLNGGTPIAAAVAAAIIHRTRPTGRQLVGLSIGMAGMVCISGPSFAGTAREALGAGLVVVAISCYGVATNLAGPLQLKYGGATVMRRVETIGALVIAPFGLWGLRSSHPTVPSVLAVTALGVVGTGVAFVAVAWVIGRIGALRTTMVTYLMPPVSLALGVIVRDERVRVINLIGIVMVLGAAVLLSAARPAAGPVGGDTTGHGRNEVGRAS